MHAVLMMGRKLGVYPDFRSLSLLLSAACGKADAPALLPVLSCLPDGPVGPSATSCENTVQLGEKGLGVLSHKASGDGHD